VLILRTYCDVKRSEENVEESERVRFQMFLKAKNGLFYLFLSAKVIDK
jgi:hypothetical protein